MRNILVVAVISACVTLAACTKEDIRRSVEQVRSEIERSGGGSELTVGEIASGLKEALRVGSAKVSTDLGKQDAYANDPDIHIPLPQKLQDVKSALGRVGLGSVMDSLELKLNRAAERAAPEAKAVFWNAISEMTLQDVMDIYDGPDDAATRYFENRMRDELVRRFEPIISDAMLEVGAIRAYDEAMKNYQALPFVPDVKTDITNHVVDESLDGLFFYLAKEEAAIRNDPVARTTELLRRIFGR